MVSKVDGRRPQADAREQKNTEAPGTVSAIETEEESRYGAMQAWENIDSIAAPAYDEHVQLSEPSASQGLAKFGGQCFPRAGCRQKGISYKTKTIDAEATAHEPFG